MLPILVYSYIDSYKLRVIITNDYIERNSIRQKHIKFADVTSVLVEPRNMTIKSVDTSIKIDFTVSEFPVIMRKVCKSIRDNKNIKATGDKKLLLELLDIQS